MYKYIVTHEFRQGSETYSVTTDQPLPALPMDQQLVRLAEILGIDYDADNESENLWMTTDDVEEAVHLTDLSIKYMYTGS